MKKIYQVIFSFVLGITASAQTITQSFNEPSIGDVDKNYRLDTSAYTGGLPISVTGSAAVWDFTKVVGAFPVMFDSIMAPPAVKGASMFPGATYAQKSSSGINLFFKSNASPAQTEWIGIYSASLSINFTNSAVMATYPINYGYFFSDPVAGTFIYNTTNGVCNGSLTVVADGAGTLNLANGVSFPNTLRLKTVEQLTMTINFLPVGTINQTTYAYYVQGKKYPVMNVQYQKYQLLVGTPTITAMAYGDYAYFTVAGVNETNKNETLTVYPNPFQDKLLLKNEGSVTFSEVFLRDIQGRLISRAASVEELSTADLAPGVYLLELKHAKGNRYQKIIKE